MDLISILSTVILITTIGTMGVAVAAYVAFKVRDRRKPQKKDPTAAEGGAFEPIFLTPYRPQRSATELEVSPSAPTGDSKPGH